MKYPKYPVFASENPFIYEFFSEGPRGKIRKAVFYTKIGSNLYNLGFGDWNEELQDVDDSNRTNNGDRDQVLATVAATAITFTNHFPDAEIFVQGSTPARTRLYQMGIGYNLLEINEHFHVRGFTDDDWEAFQHGRNYSALLINRK
jgi:hypothetical protein